MALHLYYKEGKLSKWRKVPIDFRNYDEAKGYYNKHFKGNKFKILFEEEEKQIASKRKQRKMLIKKTGKTVGRNIKKGTLAVHERLKVAGPRDMDRIRSELGEPRQKTITEYDRTLAEIKAKKREVTDKDLRKLAIKREIEREKRQQRKKTIQTKKKEWRPPPSPFGEFELNLDRTPFVDQREEAKKYEKGGPGFKTPFKEVDFNPNVNPFGFEFGSDKKKKKRR